MLELLLHWAPLRHCIAQQLPAATLKVGFPWVRTVLFGSHFLVRVESCAEAGGTLSAVIALCNKTLCIELSTWRCHVIIDPLKCG